MPSLGRRSTTDLMLLLIAATISACCLGLMVAIAVVALVSPDTDLSAVSGALANVINTLVGLMAGFLAGRTEVKRRTEGGDE